MGGRRRKWLTEQPVSQTRQFQLSTEEGLFQSSFVITCLCYWATRPHSDSDTDWKDETVQAHFKLSPDL